jgi:uroporphyrin-3 C-methyltransferase
MSEAQIDPPRAAFPESDAAEGSDSSAARSTAGEVAETGTPARGRRPAALVAVLALATALVAAVVAGSTWWQYRQFYVALSTADRESAAALERVRASMRELQDRLGASESAGASTRDTLQTLDDRVDSLPARLAALEERLRTVQGVSVDVREQWLRAQAEHYLTLANAELRMAGRWETAIAALELADDALRELGTPAVAGVREQIAAELIALRSVRLPDVAGLSYSLDRLARSVPELPMRRELTGNFAAAPAPPSVQEAEPGFYRLWLSFKEAVASMIRVEQRQAPVTMALSEQEGILLEHQLSLELLSARLALLRAEPELFRQSIAAASALLDRSFDTSAAPVESALRLLAGMADLDVAPEPPDISASLELMRRLPAGAN